VSLTSESNGTSNEPVEPPVPGIRRQLISGLALAPAGANVIMQLSRLPIGHAIVESKVERGSLSKHPIKRTRTTLAYIMVALFGTEHERAVMRREVSATHRLVRSGDGDTVPYDALDRDLQLWVAACMFRGVIDAMTFLSGPVDDARFAALLGHCAPFATTLQVSETRWPVDRAAFDAYWDASVLEVAMDGVTRAYLRGIAELDFMPKPIGRLVGPSHRFITVGFLASPFREELGFPWTTRDQRRFERVLCATAFLNRHLPRPLREFPWNLVELDTRRRIARGRPVL
jgi:uncharacterized protein (DUF2236 family)